MKIVGIAACSPGTAYTYLLKEELIKEIKKLKYDIAVEVQGNIGTEGQLSKKDIEEGDLFFIISDMEILEKERLKDKKITDIPFSAENDSTETLINKLKKELNL